jgi:hypothetical protein
LFKVKAIWCAKGSGDGHCPGRCAPIDTFQHFGKV